MNKRLREVRELQGKTQQQIAELAHISLKSYQRIEYGKQRPTVDTAILIADAVGSSVEKLFRKE